MNRKSIAFRIGRVKYLDEVNLEFSEACEIRRIQDFHMTFSHWDLGILVTVWEF